MRGSKLAMTAPLAHRMAHRLAVRGFRGADAYWRIATLIGRLPEVAVVRIEGSLSLSVHPTDSGEWFLYRGLHEREERVIARCLVDDGGTCLDIGANIGSYTLLFAHLTGPTGLVFAFEPSPTVRDRLERSTEGLSWVTVVPYAIGDASGTAELAEVGDHWGQSTLRTTYGPATAKVNVEVRRLEELSLFGHDVDVDIVKIDVEGWEQQVLAGADGLFTDARVGALMIEASPEFGPLGYLESLLAHQRYLAFAIGSRLGKARLLYRPRLRPIVSVHQITSQCNLLFVRHDKVDRIRGFIDR